MYKTSKIGIKFSTLCLVLISVVIGAGMFYLHIYCQHQTWAPTRSVSYWILSPASQLSTMALSQHQAHPNPSLLFGFFSLSFSHRDSCFSLLFGYFQTPIWHPFWSDHSCCFQSPCLTVPCSFFHLALIPWLLSVGLHPFLSCPGRLMLGTGGEWFCTECSTDPFSLVEVLPSSCTSMVKNAHCSLWSF